MKERRENDKWLIFAWKLQLSHKDSMLRPPVLPNSKTNSWAHQKLKTTHENSEHNYNTTRTTTTITLKRTSMNLIGAFSLLLSASAVSGFTPSSVSRSSSSSSHHHQQNKKSFSNGANLKSLFATKENAPLFGEFLFLFYLLFQIIILY